STTPRPPTRRTPATATTSRCTSNYHAGNAGPIPAPWHTRRVSYYPARAVVDLDQIAANVTRLQELAPRSQVMAVVKGDAYGHGLVPASRAALRGGASWLGAAQIPEALALREAGITAPILTWLYAPGAPLAQVLRA